MPSADRREARAVQKYLFMSRRDLYSPAVYLTPGPFTPDHACLPGAGKNKSARKRKRSRDERRIRSAAVLGHTLVWACARLHDDVSICRFNRTLNIPY